MNRKVYILLAAMLIAGMDRLDGKALAKEYGVVGTPTIVLLDSESRQVSVLRGSLSKPLIEQSVEDLLTQ
jgi:thioredoxin-related protein